MPVVEFVVLANHAEALNGLLYLLGGGWTDHGRPVAPDQPPRISHFGIGVSLLVSWNETNRRHHFVLRIESEDGGDPLALVEADFEVGRPPGLAPGSDQRTVMAVNADVTFPHAGGYRVLAQIGDNPPTTTSFRVHDVQVPGAQPGNIP